MVMILRQSMVLIGVRYRRLGLRLVAVFQFLLGTSAHLADELLDHIPTRFRMQPAPTTAAPTEFHVVGHPHPSAELRRTAGYRFAPAGPACCRMWQFLYFLPLPHGHGSLRPTRSPRLRIGSGFFSVCWLLAMAASCWDRIDSSPAAGKARGAASCVAAPIIHKDS